MARTKVDTKPFQDIRGNWWQYNDEGDLQAVYKSTNPEDESGFTTLPHDEDTTFKGPNAVIGGRLSGIGGDIGRWKSGDQITNERFSDYYNRVTSPNAFHEVEGMTHQSFVNDPRSGIRYENGKYVYRPETVTGDWNRVGKDASSFGALLKGALTDAPGLAMLAAGLGGAVGSSMGLIGPGSGVMGCAASSWHPRENSVLRPEVRIPDR